MVAAKQLKGLKILTKEEEDMFKAQFKDRSVEEIEHAMKDGVRRCNNSDRQDFDNEAIKLKVNG